MPKLTVLLEYFVISVYSIRVSDYSIRAIQMSSAYKAIGFTLPTLGKDIKKKKNVLQSMGVQIYAAVKKTAADQKLQGFATPVEIY